MSDDDQQDAELRARLRGADPAAPLPPLDPERVTRLLEDAMSHDSLTDETRETGTRRRSTLTWLVAAAAVVVIAGVGAFALLSGGDDGPAVPEAQQQEPTVTQLTMPTRPAARCMVPNADTLSTAAYAFDGEVTAIEDGVVTLSVSEWYAGGPTDQVEVDQSSADREALIGAPRFEDGERYLVAGSDDGDVLVCGFSGGYSQQLSRLYTKAFDAPE